MKKQNPLNNEIVITLISTIAFVAIIIMVVIFLISSLYKNINNTTQVGNFIVDYSESQSVEEKFKILDETDGMRQDPREITITNNGKSYEEYFVYIKPIEGFDIEDLMVSLDTYPAAKIGTYPNDSEKYLIYKGSIDPGYSAIHTLRFWWPSDVNVELIHKTTELEFGIEED